MYKRQKHPSKTALCTVSCNCFFPQSLIHSFFHPSPSLLITYYPINFSIKTRSPSPIPYTALHLIPLHFASFPSFHFTSFRCTLHWITFHFALQTAVAQWLRCCATNRKAAGSIPDGVIGIFH